MPTVTIRPGAANEETIPFTHGFEIEREVGKMRRLRIEVDRAEAASVTLNRKDDAIRLGSGDDHRLVDVQTGGETWELIAYSFEWDANRAGFTDGGNLRENNDQTLITNLVNEVGSWSAGTIQNLSGPLSFVFNHAHRHEAARRIEKNVPGELKFSGGGTVDYTSRLGSDRSGSVELSSSAGTIEQEINITERGRKLDGTHIRVLGAHEGEAQLFANLVPASDSDTYENRVNYSTSRWSDGDPEDWDRWSNKDVTDQATIEEEAATLGDEVGEELIEAETTVSDVDLNIGDTVQVRKPDADLDRSMRIHRLVTQAGTYNDTDSGAAVVDRVTLSTRTIFRSDDTADLRDIQRFNSGFQGSSVVVQGGGSRQPVGPSLNAVESFRFPDVEFVNEAKVEVAGLPYRAYSSGALDNANFANVAADDASGGNFDITDTFTTGITFTVPSSVSISTLSVTSSIFSQESSNSAIIRFRVFDQTTGEYYPQQNPRQQGNLESVNDGGSSITTTADIYEDVSGHTLELQYERNLSTNYTITAVAFYQAAGKHTHDPDPGIIEDFTGQPEANASGTVLPSNVDLLINGTTVATDIGSGEFETVVDVAGEFNVDAFNTIEAASDSLGHIRLTPFVEAYKQIGTK